MRADIWRIFPVPFHSGSDDNAEGADVYKFQAHSDGICRRVSISVSHAMMRFQLGMLWDAILNLRSNPFKYMKDSGSYGSSPYFFPLVRFWIVLFATVTVSA